MMLYRAIVSAIAKIVITIDLAFEGMAIIIKTLKDMAESVYDEWRWTTSGWH